MTRIPAKGDQAETFRFQGSGAGYALLLLVVAVLDAVTFGLYFPWGAMVLAKYWDENTTIRGVRNQWTGTGWEYLKQLVLQWLLSLVTLGLYAPWGYCRMQRWVDAQGPAGGKPCRFRGSGLGLVLLLAWWVPLTVLTAGIAWFWASMSVQRWFSRNTWIGEERVRFHGTGLDFAAFTIVHFLLSLVTLGLWYPWWEVALTRWLYARMELEPISERDLEAERRPAWLHALPAALALLLIVAGVHHGRSAGWPTEDWRSAAVDAVREARARWSSDAPPSATPSPATGLPAPPRAQDTPPSRATERTPVPEKGEPRLWVDQDGTTHITN